MQNQPNAVTEKKPQLFIYNYIYLKSLKGNAKTRGI